MKDYLSVHEKVNEGVVDGAAFSKDNGHGGDEGVNV